VLRLVRSDDSLGIIVKILIDSFSVHFETLRIFVDTHSLKITPVDAVKVEGLRLTTNLLELAMQSVWTKSSLSLPAKVRIHVESVIATEAGQGPFARSTLKDKQIFNRLSSGTLAWEVLGVSSVLPGFTIVIGVRIIPDRLFRAILYIGVRVESQIGAEFLRPGFMVLQIGQSLSINMVGAREAGIALIDISLLKNSGLTWM
jgi:hypothetical protein